MTAATDYDGPAEMERLAKAAVRTLRDWTAILAAGSVGELPKGKRRRRLVDDGQYEESADLLDVINSDALEVYATAKLSLDGSITVDEWVAVLGTGGPHYQAVLNGRDIRGEAWGWFGANKAESFGEFGEGRDLFDYFGEFLNDIGDLRVEQ